MTTTPYGHKVYAMAAEYPSAATLYEAAKRVRENGGGSWARADEGSAITPRTARGRRDRIMGGR